MNRIVKFGRECILELKKVSWPSKDEVLSSTRIVVISTLIISALLGLLDYLLFYGINLVM